MLLSPGRNRVAFSGFVCNTLDRMETRTYSDRREYLIMAVKKRRKKLRLKALSYLGGKCKFCGYCRETAALEFHHVHEGSKEFGLSQRGLTRSWERIKDELDKCILVCANCHREIHSGSRKIS